MRGRGCERCGHTGYRGRVGLFEVMEMTDAVRQVVLDGGSALELRRQALADGMLTLRQSGLQKVCEGQTTVDEVVRETVQ
jgi:type IV pilus assembly protein PilB